MTGFYGKTYLYKNKVIGVCHDEMFMIGRALTPSGSFQRVKILPLFLDVDEAQARLDEFARIKKLSEV